MTKLGQVKGLADKMPKLKSQFLDSYRLAYQKGICDGRLQMHGEVLNTPLPDAREVVRVDENKVIEVLRHRSIETPQQKREAASAIVNAFDLVKWKVEGE